MLRESQFGEGRRKDYQPVRILLLEDDAQFADLVRAQLRRTPLVESRLDVAGTLAEALARLAEDSYALVLADLNLPDAAELKAVEALAGSGEQLVVVLTASQDPALRAGALEAGAYDFLAKEDLRAADLERLMRLAALQSNTHRSLRESEARFRGLVELSSDWYWEQDEALRFTRLDGRSDPLADVAVGKRRWEVPGLTAVSCSWQEHREALEARRPFRNFEYSWIDESGKPRYVAVSGEPVYDARGRFRGYRGLATDTTERKRAEDDLRRFRLAMDNSADIIVLIDRATMRFADVNLTACRLLGYSREELLAMGPHQVLPVSRDELAKSYDAFIADPNGAAAGMRSHYRCKDGSLLPFESTRRVLHSGGRWFISAISRDLRDRIASEKALQESEARFRSLTALSSDWYWEQDAQLRLTYMSTIEETGLDASAFLGRYRWDQPALNLTAEDWARHRTQLERHEAFRDFEIERAVPGGDSVWISLSGEPVFDDAGRFTGYRGVGSNITQRKRAEHEVRRLSRMYAALGAANEAILRSKSPQEVFDRACEIAVEAGGFLLGTVFVLDPQGGRLSRAAAFGPGVAAAQDNVVLLDEPRPGGLLGQACRAGTAIISNDYRNDPRMAARQGGPQGGVGSAAAFPLFVEGKLAGVIGLRHAERNAFAEELASLLQRLADNISFALESLQRDARLLASEARFRGLTRLSSDMYWAQDSEYRFTDVSGTGSLAAGRQRILGKRRWEQDYFNMSPRAWEEHKALLEARLPFRDLELGRIGPSGEKVWVSSSGEPVFDEQGAFTGYRGVAKDISARKSAERLIALEHRVTRCLAGAETTTGALREVMQALCESESWESARYFHHDETAGLMRYQQAWSSGNEAMKRFNDASHEIVFRIGEGLVGQAWQSGEPLWVADVTCDARVANVGLARAAGVHGAFVFPVAFEGRTIGVLSISSPLVREPDAQLLQTLRVIGSQLAQFLRRKQAEQRQAEHLHYQERLSRFGQAALGRRQAAELAEEAVQSVLETLVAASVAYFEPGPRDGEVVLRAVVGGGSGVDPGELALGRENPVLDVLRSKRRAIAQDAALVPVRSESHVRGVLCVCFRRGEPLSAEALNFIEAMASVLSSGLQRIDSEGRLAYLAQFDPLTGLPNRALLADRFSQMIVQARRHERSLGVLFIDLDEFKLVNDTLGHAGGDELLKEVAVRLQAAVRPGDTVARISGDEFAVVLADMARTEDAALVAHKVIERLGAPVDLLGHEIFVTASVGIAVFPGDGADAEALIGAADAAMYRAKQSGRNAFQFFTAEINQRSRARAQLGAELRRALEREEFALLYQPKFRLADRATGGAEALLRWRHPERGMVSPADFIPVLEETGLIVPVGEWVLRRACEDLKAWRAAGLDAGPVAVNLSARQFRLPDLDARLKAVVAAAGVDPGMIELEITESQLMQDPDHAIRVMRSLREAGMRIAIDDFGTGYSSLAYLTRFPVGSLKIDRSFVATVNEDASAGAIVRTIIEMAHTLGFTVVAEGIETEAQADYLRRHRCEQGQGYLFARPMSAQDLAALLAKHCP
jgi:diguanylate cyclase (GGDEF)-like protein/PAS domain S-box-containing protein